MIGTTTMDPLLSVIMANMAKVGMLEKIKCRDVISTYQVKPGSLVVDPFVGTGQFAHHPAMLAYCLHRTFSASLLYPCAYFGAFVCGSDICYQTIHGKGKSTRKLGQGIPAKDRGKVVLNYLMFLSRDLHHQRAK